MEKKIVIVAQELKDCIHNEDNLGVNQLVEFADTYSINKDLADEAVILKLSYQFTSDKKKRSDYIKKMMKLIDMVVSDYLENADKTSTKEERRHFENKISYYKSQSSPQGVVVKCENISKTFKGKHRFKLSNVNLNLKLGEITAIFGENASGKTTLIRQILGELAPDTGSISYPYFNQENSKKLDWELIKHKIAYVPQELDEWQGNLKDNLYYEANLHGLRGKDNEREVEFISHRLGLENYCDRAWNELSGGYKLRFALARALVWKPQLLILDEPLANLDPRAQLVLLNDLKAFSKSFKNPISVLFTSQTLDETEAIADKIIFLKGGLGNEGSKVVFYDDKDSLEKDREYNKFTFSGKFNQNELANILFTLKPVSIYFTGIEYVVKMPLEITSKDVIRCLALNGKIEVNGFSNISRSVKSMFV